MRRCGVLVALMLAAVGCGQGPVPDETGHPPSSTGLPDPNAMPPPMGANGACNDVTPAGGLVTDTLGTAAPALGGGAMADGRYVLTRYEWYSPNTLHTRTITLVITGSGAYGQYLWTRDQEPEERATLSIATSGNQIAMRGVCPLGSALEWDQYGITDSGLTLFSSRDNKAAFFARQ